MDHEAVRSAILKICELRIEQLPENEGNPYAPETVANIVPDILTEREEIAFNSYMEAST